MSAHVFVSRGFFPEAGQILGFELKFDDPPTLTLLPLPAVTQGGSFPLWMATDAAKKFCYATDGGGNAVHAYSLGEDGALTHLGKQSSGGGVPCHLSVVGKTVLVANYSGSNVASFLIAADGSLGPATVHAHASGTGEAAPEASGRQEAAHPHMIEPGPAGAPFAFVADLGTNSVVSYALDAQAATLRKAGELRLHAGAGPRHLAFSAAAPFAYLLNELDNTVTALHYEAAAGAFRPVAGSERVSLLPLETPHACEGGASELVLSRDGRFAYATVRACKAAVFNVVSTLSLDTTSGACALLETTPCGGNMPWGAALAGPDDALLLVQNQHARPHADLAKNGADLAANGEGAGCIALFRRDAATGKLSATGVAVEVPSAMGITVVPRA